MTLRLDGEKLRLLGKFAADGTFTGTLPRPGKTAANITLSFDRVLVPQLTGTITIDSTPFTLAGGRSPFGAKNPAPTAGTHTLLLPRDPTQNDPALYPAGSGYALLAVSRSGKLQAIGRLGDHTAFALSTPVFADGTAPLFLQPYAKRGLLAGTLTFLSDSDEISGTLRWQKPATSKGRYPTGFSGTTAVLGSRWTPPARGSAALDITGWHFNIGTTSLTTSLDVHNRFTLAPADIAKLKLTASTGLLTGTYKPTPTAKPTPFTGALLQRQRLGRGLFLTPTQSTPFELKEN